MYQADPTQTSQ